jgi:hypothetical protein
MSTLNSAISAINTAASRATATTDFYDDILTGDNLSNITNPNNNISTPTIAKQIKTQIEADTYVSQAIKNAGWDVVGDFATLPQVSDINDVLSSKSVTNHEDALWRTNQALPYTPIGTDPTQAPELGKWVAVAQGELKSIARSLNVADSAVIYSTDTSTVLDNVQYIYDASAETTWGVPVLDNTGETIVSVTGSALVTSGGSYDLLKYFDENNSVNIKGFGAVADYAGVPLYDGNDSARITATDNTSALDDALNESFAVNGVLNLYVPSGHYGFKLDSITKTASANWHTLIIRGDGVDVSILDFIFEDVTETSYVQPASAHSLLHLDGFDTVIFKDITTKATTKNGPVDGNMDPSETNESVYYGSVWFSKIENCADVKFINNKTSHCNYRGHSVVGDDTTLDTKSRVIIDNCIGCYNSSSGYWVDKAYSTKITNSEFYRNGYLGITATGYGVTTNSNADRVFIDNCVFYENYRKGFDRHGGTFGMEVYNTKFIDNVLYDIYDNKWAMSGLYNNSTDKNNTVIKDCDFVFNRNTSFISEALTANAGGKLFKSFWLLGDSNDLAVPQGYNENCSISSSRVSIENGMSETLDSILLFATSHTNTNYSKLSVDIENILFDRTVSDAYTLYTFFNESSSGDVSFDKCDLSRIPDMHAIYNGNTANTPLITMNGVNLTLTRNDLCLFNQVLVANTSAGENITWNEARSIQDNTISLKDMALETIETGGGYDSSFRYFATKYMFGSSSDEATHKNNVGFGDCEQYYEWVYSKSISPTKNIDISSTNKSIGDKVTILFGAIDGNVELDLVGRIGASGDAYKAYYKFTSATETVVTASSYISSSYLFSQPIQLNGGDTNFIAEGIEITFDAATDGTVMFSGSLQTVLSTTPLIAHVFNS